MFIFMGMSGAGKGTQSGLLAQETGYSYVSSGDIVRDHATDEQRKLMLSGKWLSSDEILAMVDQALKKLPDENRVILDGTPRTLDQAEWLLGESRKGRFHIEAVFNLQVPLDVVMKRLQNRHRVDDTLASIKLRLKQHQEAVEPILAYWHAQHVPVYDLDGSADPYSVHRQVLTSLQGARR